MTRALAHRVRHLFLPPVVLLAAACASAAGAPATATESVAAPTAPAARPGQSTTTPDGPATPSPAPSEPKVGSWKPPPAMSWQWQLTGLPLDRSVDVEMFDIDLFDTDAQTVADLKAEGRRVICYVSAGSFEEWRPDADRFTAVLKGRSLDGWPGERWLDIRDTTTLRAIMLDRIGLCRAKGFDAIEFDNVDGYANDTGFPLSYRDQLEYNRWLAEAARGRGLSPGLKNDLEQVKDLVPYFDWALNEQCFRFNECELLLPFIEAGKPVFQVEYELATSQFCPRANALNFNSMRKNQSLDAYRESCR